MCHNRPKYAEKAIESILNQTEKQFKFIVSDNSSNYELQEILKETFPFVENISWVPGVPAFSHFKNVIAMIDTPYFMLFHDDDLMELDFIETVKAEIVNRAYAAAIATNAWLINDVGERIGESTAFVSSNPSELFQEKKQFLLRYLANDLGGIAPFCSYVYNTKLTKGLLPDFSRARNYCDTIFLMEVIGRGPIAWINKPLIRTRIHENNLSNNSGVRDYKSFLAIIRKDSDLKNCQRYIDEYRFMRLFVALKRRRRFPVPALKYFFAVFPKLFFYSPFFRGRVFSHLLRRRQYLGIR